MARTVRDYEPEMIRKLMAAVGNNTVHAAHLMGCHPTTVSKAIDNSLTSKRQELRASAALAKLRDDASAARKASEDLPSCSVIEPPASHNEFNAPVVMLVTIPEHKLQSFMKVANLMGIEQVPL